VAGCDAANCRIMSVISSLVAGAHRMAISFGDKVRIASTALTDSLGLAGLTGLVYGETTPSVTKVDVVGELTGDYAINICLDGRDETLWFAPELLEFVDHAPGTEIVLGNKRLVRSASGQWVEDPPPGSTHGIQAITVGSSRRHFKRHLISALCFVAAGVFILVMGEEPLTGWWSIVFFGGCALVFARELADARPRIIIDERGITDRTLNMGVIEWSDIRSATVRRMLGNAFICLELRSPAKYTGRLSPTMQRIVKLNRHLGYSEVSLNLSATDSNPEQLVELILHEAALRSGQRAV
jgi:hypothetical protein